MKKYLVAFFAFASVLSAQTKKITLPNGNIVETLPDGTSWISVHADGNPLPHFAFQVAPNMPTAGQFETFIVENLPKGDIVGAPQSVQIQILGDCQNKTYQIYGMLPYDGKMRAGFPEPELSTGPEEVARRFEPGSPIAYVFSIVCKR